MKRKQYPFNEGDDYWTIENNKVIWSSWDDVSEELHDANPNRVYFKTEEDATLALRLDNVAQINSILQSALEEIAQGVDNAKGIAQMTLEGIATKKY